MKACIVLGGGSDLVDVSGYEIVICADSGYERLRSGNAPTHIVGDMDSIDPEMLERARSSGITTLVYPPEKDFSDGEAALGLAMSKGADDITIEGTLGDRTDHLLTTFHLLNLIPRGISARLRIGHDTISLLREGQRTTIRDPTPIISIVPSCGDAAVTTRGMKYEMHSAVLTLGTTRGIHNEPLAKEPEVYVEEGEVFLILCGG